MHLRPPIDYGLCSRVEKYATGEHVHTAANLLAAYLAEHAIDEFDLASFRAAEKRLRTFAASLSLRCQAG